MKIQHNKPEDVGPQAGLGRQSFRAAPDPAAVVDRRPPRHRRRAGHPLQRLCRRTAGRHASDDRLRGMQ